METIVIGLGGNALLSPGRSQKVSLEHKNAARAVRGIADLAKTDKYNIVITHGNGPQVGDELVKNDHAKKIVPKLPLYILTAETEASIGTILETELRSSLRRLHVDKDISVILTHVIVERKDKAFLKPTKPIGPLYSKLELERELRLENSRYIKINSKYRRVVPSPVPIKILEAGTISRLVNSTIVIAGGGGGIPVFLDNGNYVGAEAVVDKDRTTQILANSINADKMVILTDVDYVYSEFKSRKNPIKSIKADVLKGILDRFEEGTMRPKLDACIRFIENGGKAAYIGDLYRLNDILKGETGTVIMP